MSDLIRRQDAIDAVASAEPKDEMYHYYKQIAVDALSALPSAEAVCEDTQTEERTRFVAKETELAHIEARLENAEKSLQELPKYTNCTEFIEWLTEVVLNDEDWELNAVAYGEVIARKLKKLGLLEVKDGYYIRHIENNTKESDLVYRPSAVCDDCIWHVCNYNKVDWDVPSADKPTKHTLPDGTEIPIDEESYEIGYTHGQMAESLKKSIDWDGEDGYISRHDAVNEIHKYFVEEIDKTPTEIDEDGDELYADMPTVNSLLACNKELSKRIKALPSAETVKGWVPVSERLPSEDGRYLVCMSWEYNNMGVLSWADGWNCHRDYDGKIRRESEIDGVDIIAWLPLPEPYKGGNTDD